MDAALDFMRVADEFDRECNPPKQARGAPPLLWEVFEETPKGVYPFGWTLHVGYHTEWDEDGCMVYIQRAYLDTDKRHIELKLSEVNTDELEAVIKENEEVAAEEHCAHLAGRDDDRGDWEMEQRRDRES
jgi:hypothetical protein